MLLGGPANFERLAIRTKVAELAIPEYLCPPFPARFTANCRAKCVAEAELAFTPIALNAMLHIAVDQHSHD